MTHRPHRACVRSRLVMTDRDRSSPVVQEGFRRLAEPVGPFGHARGGWGNAFNLLEPQVLASSLTNVEKTSFESHGHSPRGPAVHPPGPPKPLRTCLLPAPPPSSRATRSLPYLLAPHSRVRAARSRVPTSPSDRTAQTVQNGSVGAPRPPTRADRTTPQRMTGTRASFRAPMRAHRANRSPSSGTTDPLPTPPKRNGLCDLL